MTYFPKVAFLIPCLNEEVSIADVVFRCKASLPNADVYVYDNGSEDETKARALEAGAIVRVEPNRGKGNVVRRMFADVEADIYVMLDGDGTYEIEAAPSMVQQLIENQLDLVTGNRVDAGLAIDTYRKGHRLGNLIFTTLLRKIFNSSCEDVLSGFRVMTRRFVKSFPTVSRGFEIEVEMTAHASLLRIPSAEFSTSYVERAPQSFSKLNTYRDGFRIAISLFRIFRSYSPSRFFGSISLLSLATSVVFLIREDSLNSNGMATGLIPGLLFLTISALSLFVGVILNAISRSRVEFLRLTYLSITR